MYDASKDGRCRNRMRHLNYFDTRDGQLLFSFMPQQFRNRWSKVAVWGARQSSARDEIFRKGWSPFFSSHSPYLLYVS